MARNREKVNLWATCWAETLSNGETYWFYAPKKIGNAPISYQNTALSRPLMDMNSVGSGRDTDRVHSDEEKKMIRQLDERWGEPLNGEMDQGVNSSYRLASL